MKRAFLAIAAAAALSATIQPVRADVVTDWCDKASDAAYVIAGGPGTGGARAVVMAQIAMFEAVNSIEPRYTPYRALLPAQPGWSQEAAASAAAYGVLTKLVSDPAKIKDYEAFHAARPTRSSRSAPTTAPRSPTTIAPPPRRASTCQRSFRSRSAGAASSPSA